LISRSLRLPKIFLSRPEIIAIKGGYAECDKAAILTRHPGTTLMT
jgi:hypothetical protein